MQELVYDVTTLARIIIDRDMSVTDQKRFLYYVWNYEKAFLSYDYQSNQKQFFLDVMNETNYWINKDTYDREIEAVNHDLDSIGSDCQYVKTDEYYALGSYFMELRLRINFLDNHDYLRMKLRTLLRAHGYKRRTQKLNAYLKQCMYFYHIETYTKGGKCCDIEKIKLDDMITFRVV